MTHPIPRELAPGESQLIQGIVVLRDWERNLRADARLEVVRHDDGAAYVELLRYTEPPPGFTDARRVPIGETTYEALADALFAPKGEGPALATPVVLDGVVSTSIDGHRHVNHVITEEVGADGRITTTVEGIATDNIETVTVHEPAVAAYLARKAEIMRRTACVEGAVVTSGAEGADPIPLGAGRPDLSASGMMSYRLRWAYRADASPRFSVEIAGGVTRVTIRGLDGPSAVVASASWEVERHWRRLLYAGIVTHLPEWWVRGVQGRPTAEAAAQEASPPSAPPKPVHHLPPGMNRLSPRPRRRYPRIRMEGGALLGVRRGKGREFTYAPKLDITVADGHVCAFVGLDDRPVMSDHPAVVAFFESFDEALRRDKSRQVREQTPAASIEQPGDDVTLEA